MSVKKKVRLGQIEPDPDQFALIVHYTTELHHLDEFGNPVGSESQPGAKTLRVPHGLSGAEIPGLAQQMVEKCKYISPSKVGDVEAKLMMLMQYEMQMQQMQQMQQSHSRADAHPRAESHSRGDRDLHSRSDSHTRSEMHSRGDMHSRCGDAPTPTPSSRKRQGPILPSADVRFIDEYSDKLYEDKIEVKVHSAKCILRVCTEPPNLEILAEHDSLINVLSREMKDGFRKSSELSIAIVCTFLCFSHFTQFHPILNQHHCGDVTMRCIEFESTRHEFRKKELDKKIQQVQDRGEVAKGEDKRQLAKDEKSYKAKLSKQNKLMHVCLMVLLNLAEEITTERKMVNRKIPQILTQLLDRTHDDLLVVALQFLKKLSVFEENKEQISAPETLTRLVQLAQHSNLRVALLALKVLYNLSFDETIRASLVESGIVKLLVDHLRNPPFRHIVLRLLYHFSMDDRCKSLMPYYQEGMLMLLQLVVHFPEPRVGKDLVALVVNLATHPHAAQAMTGSGLFPQVLLRVLKYRDPLLCKVIRHVSSHPDVMERMYQLLQSDSVRLSKWMNEFVRMALCCVDNPDLLVEVLGTLSNMTLQDIPWGELCEAGLVDLLHRLLVPSFSEDDIVLECVMLVGNLALSGEAAQHLAGSRLPSMLQDLLVEKCDDEEITLQLLFSFQCLLRHDDVRDVILQDTDIAQCVMRFAQHRNPAIVDQALRTLQVLADHCIDVQMGSDAEIPAWTEQVKAFRFQQHNAEWCQCVLRELNGSAGMSPGGSYSYGQDEGSGDEDEEEFAFHWAGGDAVDADDLASRDWGNKDVDEFMHTSRMRSALH